jgi:hypothetical protein
VSAALPVRVTRMLRSRLTHLVTAVTAVVSLLALCLLASATPATSSGYIAKLNNTANSVTTAQYFSCAAAAAGDKLASTAIFQWYLNDATTLGTAADSSGNADTGAYKGLSTTSSTATPIACPRDGGSAYVLNGSSNFLVSAKTSANPTAYSVEVWFKTSVAGGKLIGLGNDNALVLPTTSGTYDRHLYIDTAGKIEFGSYNSASSSPFQVLVTPTVVTDNAWHHVVGTQSTTAGMTLYLDGTPVASNAAYTAAQTNTGYWRVGYDALSGWPNAPSNLYFTGQMRFAAAYASVLTAAQVKSDWAAGR